MHVPLFVFNFSLAVEVRVLVSKVVFIRTYSMDHPGTVIVHMHYHLIKSIEVWEQRTRFFDKNGLMFDKNVKPNATEHGIEIGLHGWGHTKALYFKRFSYCAAGLALYAL